MERTVVGLRRIVVLSVQVYGCISTTAIKNPGRFMRTGRDFMIKNGSNQDFFVAEEVSASPAF